MSQAFDTEPQKTTAETATEEEVAESPQPQTTYSASGPLPPVATTSKPAGPSASDRAFGGEGLQQLEALLAKGQPPTKDIVALIDAHRDEHDAILALVEQKLGSTYAESVRTGLSKLRASVDRREVVAGDPGDPQSGFFVASQKEKGARWQTADGRFTGTANKDGLDSRYRLDSRDALHAHVGKDRVGTLAYERDGKNQGELFGSYKGADDYEAGVRRTQPVGPGQLTEGVHHHVTKDGTQDGVFGTYKQGTTSVTGEIGTHDGHLAESASVTTKPTPETQVSASVAHDERGTTGQIAGSYQDQTTHVDGNVTRGLDQTSLHLGASERLTPQDTLSGRLDHVAPDHGASQTTLGVSERHKSKDLVHGLDLEAGTGARDYFKTTGTLDAQLAPDLYGGAFGSYQTERGHQDTSQLGASLTFTPSEKTALTLAGVIDQSGRLETRLQLDVFKSRIEGVGDLAQHKKDALVSVFLSYSQGGTGSRLLDDEFGAPQADTGGGDQRIGAGIRIKF